MQQQPASIQARIRTQVEFYLSSANLLVDEHLQKAIKRCKGSWLPLTYILNCHQIKMLLFELRLRPLQKRKRLAKILQDSEILKVNNFRVKRKIRFNHLLERAKMVYVQLDNEESVDRLRNHLKTTSNNEGVNLSFKNGKRWLVVVADKKQNSEEMQRYLRTSGGSFEIRKILNGSEWLEQQKRCKQIYALLRNDIKNNNKRNGGKCKQMPIQQ